MIERGNLHDQVSIPAQGETTGVLARLGGTVIEHIVSSASLVPVDQLQDHDEWVVVLDGVATLDVDGEPVELAAGDWLLIPAHTRHRVLTTTAGTRWLAVHGSPLTRGVQ